jgi:hypothetical protein
MNVIGVCGDNCSCCPRYIATQEGSLEALNKVKELWVRLGFRQPDSPARELACFGCGPENKCAYYEVRECAYGKGIDNCGLCQDYPCEVMDAVFEKSENIKSHASSVCASEEMDALTRAFFSKRGNLDKIHFRTNMRI